MDIDQARAYLKVIVAEEFTDKTFHEYVDRNLAGDFAVEIATVVQNADHALRVGKQEVEQLRTALNLADHRLNIEKGANKAHVANLQGLVESSDKQVRAREESGLRLRTERDRLIGEVEHLTVETKILDGQIKRWRLSSNRHLSKLIRTKGEIVGLQLDNDAQALTIKLLREKLYGTGGIGESGEAVAGMSLPDKERAWLEQFQHDTTFDPLHLDELHSGEMTFDEVAQANIRWFRNWYDEAYLSISRDIESV